MHVIYEKHPVSPKRKAELRSKGYKIIDARFAPEGHETAASDQGGDKSMTVAELRDALTERGIAFDPKAKKPELQALLDAASEQGGE